MLKIFNLIHSNKITKISTDIFKMMSVKYKLGDLYSRPSRVSKKIHGFLISFVTFNLPCKMITDGA